MQQGCGNGLVTETDVADDDLRHGDRVQDIGLAAAPAHVFVGFVRKLKRLLDNGQFFRVGTAPGSRFLQDGIIPLDGRVVFGGKY